METPDTAKGQPTGRWSAPYPDKHDLEVSRVTYPGACYHVTARENDRKPIFPDDRDRQRFLDRLEGMTGRYRLIVQ